MYTINATDQYAAPVSTRQAAGAETTTHVGAAPPAAALAIMTALQTTLEPDQLVERFAEQAREVVPFDGYRYEHARGTVTCQRGVAAGRHLAYELAATETPLGELVFYRRRAFSHAERETLDALVWYLLHPLRNALAFRELQHAARHDTLTGLGNRRALADTIERELARAERTGSPLSVVSVDIDHFKRVNDTYGHSAGDVVLREVARCLAETVRTADAAYRLGGEEFLILLHDTDAAGAERLAERLREAVAARRYSAADTIISVTISLGSAQWRPGENTTALFERVDQALYRAKHHGRNRVEPAA